MTGDNIERENGDLLFNDLNGLGQEYTDAKQYLDALRHEASALAERFGRLARGLSMHPERMVIGTPLRLIDHPSEWDVVPDQPLPRIESVARLTDAIRAASAKVDGLRARLILRDGTDVIEQAEGFFR